MSKDANSFGHDKAMAWESRGFVYTKKRMHRFDTPSDNIRHTPTSPMAFIHHAGSLWTTRIFYILFQSHIPRNASGAWHRRLFFVKRAFGNPHKSIGR